MPAASGNSSSNSSRPKVGRTKLGSPLGISPVTATPSAGRPNPVATMIDRMTTASATGPPRKRPRAEQEQQDRHQPDRQHDPVDAVELPDQRDQAIEEIAPAAGNAKQTRQLRHDDGEPGASLEADQNAIADQAYQH